MVVVYLPMYRSTDLSASNGENPRLAGVMPFEDDFSLWPIDRLSLSASIGNQYRPKLKFNVQTRLNMADEAKLRQLLAAPGQRGACHDSMHPKDTVGLSTRA